MMRNSLFLRVTLLGLMGLSLVAAATTLARQTGVVDQLNLLVDVRHELVSQYVEAPDQEKLTQAAVRAMVEALDDPYTVYFDADDLEPFDKQIRGTFSGIGAEVDIHERRLRIITPLDDSPALKAGIMAGDIVLEIDGQSTEGLTINDAIKRLQGPEGTKVTVRVRHFSGEEAVIPITRAQINVVTVKGARRQADGAWDFMLDPGHGIGYIRITQFTDKTAPAVRAALDQLLKANARGLILDMRFNPGGLLDSAVQISDMFLAGGQRIVSVKGRVVPEHVSMATDEGTIPPIPLVVLANEASASAAEVVTGALADNQRACFIGTRTFGKGSVQQVHMLAAGEGAVKVTNAYYYLPNGRNIHRRKDAVTWGVDPADGFWVTMTAEQTRKMLEVRRDSDILRNGKDSATQPTLSPDDIARQLADPQLAAGLTAILGKLDTGAWPQVGQSGATELARLAKRDNLQRQREALEKRLGEINKDLAKLDTPTTQPAPGR